MFRNNERYLNDFYIKIFEKMEKMYEIEFIYYIIENNSEDKTRDILKEFISSRKNSKLILFNLKKDFKNVGDGRNFNRISNLAKIRNKLVDNSIPIYSEWSLFIDSNIFFPEDIFEKIFSIEENENLSIKDDIGMFLPYTQQLLIPEIHKINTEKPVMVGHYYDTYPFVDEFGKSHYPNCAFEKCSLCKHKEKGIERKKILKEKKLIDVKSGFGGFVLIRSEIINDKRIRWDTISYDIDNDQSLCEHILFCERLRLISGKRIVLNQELDMLYRTF